MKEGNYEQAFQQFAAAITINASNVQALNRFAAYLATCHDTTQRDYELAIRLASWAGELCHWNDADVVHTLAVAYNNFAIELGNRGEFARAIECYQKAIERDPHYAAPLFNLALLRTACPAYYVSPTWRSRKPGPAWLPAEERSDGQ